MKRGAGRQPDGAGGHDTYLLFIFSLAHKAVHAIMVFTNNIKAHMKNRRLQVIAQSPNTPGVHKESPRAHPAGAAPPAEVSVLWKVSSPAPFCTKGVLRRGSAASWLCFQQKYLHFLLALEFTAGCCARQVRNLWLQMPEQWLSLHALVLLSAVCRAWNPAKPQGFLFAYFY